METIEIITTNRYKTIIDCIDIPLVIGKAIGVSLVMGKPYARISCVTGKGGVKRYNLHNYLASPGEGIVTDHINGDTLDNRRANLRICNHSENMRNSRHRKHSTCNYKGVYQLKSGRYGAKITCNGKSSGLGAFDTELEAAIAYNRAAEKHHKQFAHINIFSEVEGE